MIDDRVWKVSRDRGLCISFPQNGDKITKYAEQNRQEHIRYDNEFEFSSGWLPHGREGWWRFPVPESEELVVNPFADVYVIVQGTKRKLVWE